MPDRSGREAVQDHRQAAPLPAAQRAPQRKPQWPSSEVRRIKTKRPSNTWDINGQQMHRSDSSDFLRINWPIFTLIIKDKDNNNETHPLTRPLWQEFCRYYTRYINSRHTRVLFKVSLCSACVYSPQIQHDLAYYVTPLKRASLVLIGRGDQWARKTTDRLAVRIGLCSGVTSNTNVSQSWLIQPAASSPQPKQW